MDTHKNGQDWKNKQEFVYNLKSDFREIPFSFLFLCVLTEMKIAFKEIKYYCLCTAKNPQLLKFHPEFKDADSEFT